MTGQPGKERHDRNALARQSTKKTVKTRGDKRAVMKGHQTKQDWTTEKELLKRPNIAGQTRPHKKKITWLRSATNFFRGYKCDSSYALQQ
jgi:hypothetical protein